MRLTKLAITVLLLSVFCTLLIHCVGSTVSNTTDTDTIVSAKDLDDGKMLAAQYCRSCHQLPDPSLLDKQTWKNHVLPVMGLFLGIKDHALDNAPKSESSDLNYLPDGPVIDSVKWKHIIAYFVKNAPEKLLVPDKELPLANLPFFKIEDTAPEWFSTVSIASYVKIDTSVLPHRIIVNNGITSQLAILDNQSKKLKSCKLNGPVVDMFFQKQKVTVATIGAELTANNLKKGDISAINIKADGTIIPQGKPLFDKLARPVTVAVADLNQDHQPDYVIAQYGNLAGRLSWMENLGRKGFKEHVLRDKPGCLKIIVKDFNHDGLPDVLALFAQADEGIFLYTNKGHGVFEEKQLLGFPPSYGSSSFDLVDFNKDGYPDIIYTCGDNGDYSQILKPYHGLYIFLNDGKDNFKQKYFFPINGCYKAIARDFDGDGDLDIATISNFPAAITPWESFLYFENKGDFKFQTYTLPGAVPFQKGLTMDAADIDGDGKTDLLLGNGFYTSDQSGRYIQPLFIVLKNITKRKP